MTNNLTRTDLAFAHSAKSKPVHILPPHPLSQAQATAEKLAAAIAAASGLDSAQGNYSQQDGRFCAIADGRLSAITVTTTSETAATLDTFSISSSSSLCHYKTLADVGRPQGAVLYGVPVTRSQSRASVASTTSDADTEMESKSESAATCTGTGRNATSAPVIKRAQRRRVSVDASAVQQLQAHAQPPVQGNAKTARADFEEQQPHGRKKQART